MPATVSNRTDAPSRDPQGHDVDFRDIVELAAIGIARLDLGGAILYANRHLGEMLGYGDGELIGRTMRSLSHPEDRFLVDAARNDMHAGLRDSLRAEKRYLKRDGQTVWAEVRAVLKPGAAGTAPQDICIIQNITERKAAEAALRASEERFRTLTTLHADWYWETDAEGRFTRMEGHNRRHAQRHIGRTLEELGYRAEHGWAHHHAPIHARVPFRDAVIAIDTSRGTHHLSLCGEPVFDASGRYLGYRGVSRDISDLRRSTARIEFLATHDSLTGLHNRTTFNQLLAAQIETAERQDAGFAVLFIDLDRFKVINDSLGHEAGDALLRDVAGRLKSALRSSDALARLGGDEFVVLLRDCDSEADIAVAADKLMAAVLRPVMVGGHECRVTASVGIARFPQDGRDEHALMKSADIAMYAAKEGGKNGYRFYAPGMHSASTQRLAMETLLRRALERGELALAYQPKIDLATDAILGVEALLRWHSAELGLVSPAQFIPIAEETGLIVPIGKWVLQTACAQSMAWQRAGLNPGCMAVNLSPRQFADPGLLHDICATLQATGLPAGMLELEITESVVMHTPDHAIQLLTDIKAMGVRLAIDDFGTGYSSLAQLKRFPIDTLKVDRSFIRDVPSNADDMAITEAIIAMGRSLSLTVVAEGVETSAQKAFLNAHACHQMQGYHFSRPIGPEELAELLASTAAVTGSSAT